MTFNVPEQPGGFSEVEFYLLSEVGNFPEVLTDANAGQLTFDPEVNDVDGSIVPDSITVNDASKFADNGWLWPIDINFTYLSRNAAMEQLLEQYTGAGIAITCGNDGQRKVMGTPEEPVYMAWSINYGTKLEDAHGINIKISGTQSQRPVYYNP